MLKILILPLLIVFSFVFHSCKTREKMVYFQGSSSDTLTSVSNYTPILKTDDYLSIQISGDDPEAVVPFNLPPTTALLSGYSNGTPALSGYLIDSKGEINLPVIGKINVLGLNRNEAASLIEGKLKDYIKNPIVQIQIQNYKVTVLGDVKNPGTFKIPNERVTIIEALGIAGDLQVTANRNNILVIRDENGVKSEFRVDLTKKDVFNSPVYYLAQNDVIYVEPNFVKRSESTIWRASGPLFISLASLLVTTLTFFTIK
jgi:polysaccharide biosynthesis/export protein